MLTDKTNLNGFSTTSREGSKIIKVVLDILQVKNNTQGRLSVSVSTRLYHEVSQVRNIA